MAHFRYSYSLRLLCFIKGIKSALLDLTIRFQTTQLCEYFAKRFKIGYYVLTQNNKSKRLSFCLSLCYAFHYCNESSNDLFDPLTLKEFYYYMKHVIFRNISTCSWALRREVISYVTSRSQIRNMNLQFAYVQWNNRSEVD